MAKRKTTTFRRSPTESRIIIERIRELVGTYGVTRTARALGVSESYVSFVKDGKKGVKKHDILINDLGLRRIAEKLCRRCGKPTTMVTQAIICVTCGLNELERKGVIVILGVDDPIPEDDCK